VTLQLQGRVAEACALLAEGRPVLLYDGDGREAESDLFFAAHLVQPEHVRALRRDAGGLVFLAVDAPVARRFGLPFLQDVLAGASGEHPVLRALQPGRLPYDARSAFSVTLNHRDTFTGIPDRDRALTIRRFAELALQTASMRPEDAQAALGREFRSPGHVALCLASEPLLEARRGHTELAAALARMASLPGVLAGAEMLDGDGALPRRGAQAWARAHGTVLVEAGEVADAWARFINPPGDGRA
jgi:3,4-dihydroxy 2-butanone 4-phosphate synthase